MTPRQHAIDAINQFKEVLSGQRRDRLVELPREAAIQVVAGVIEDALLEASLIKKYTE